MPVRQPIVAELLRAYDLDVDSALANSFDGVRDEAPGSVTCEPGIRGREDADAHGSARGLGLELRGETPSGQLVDELLGNSQLPGCPEDPHLPAAVLRELHAVDPGFPQRLLKEQPFGVRGDVIKDDEHLIAL